MDILEFAAIAPGISKGRAPTEPQETPKDIGLSAPLSPLGRGEPSPDIQTTFQADSSFRTVHPSPRRQFPAPFVIASQHALLIQLPESLRFLLCFLFVTQAQKGL